MELDAHYDTSGKYLAPDWHVSVKIRGLQRPFEKPIIISQLLGSGSHVAGNSVITTSNPHNLFPSMEHVISKDFACTAMRSRARSALYMREPQIIIMTMVHTR